MPLYLSVGSSCGSKQILDAHFIAASNFHTCTAIFQLSELLQQVWMLFHQKLQGRIHAGLPAFSCCAEV